MEYPLLTGAHLFWIQAVVWTLFGVSLKHTYDLVQQHRRDENGGLR